MNASTDALYGRIPNITTTDYKIEGPRILTISVWNCHSAWVDERVWSFIDTWVERLTVHGSLLKCTKWLLIKRKYVDR